jgi:hypothetical protein
MFLSSMYPAGNIVPDKLILDDLLSMVGRHLPLKAQQSLKNHKQLHFSSPPLQNKYRKYYKWN